MKEKVVLVEWNDASFNSGYYDKTTPEKYYQLETKTVGFVIKSTPNEILISGDSSVSEGQVEYRHINTIPKKMIIRIIRLKG